MEFQLLIDNEKRPASDRKTFQRENPFSGEVASIAAAASTADARAAVESAAAAFPNWAKTGPNARRAVLNRAADLLQSRASDFISIMAAETGASPGWAMMNAHLAAGMLREAAALTTQIKGEILPSDRPGCFSMLQRVPVGVCLAIAPWNAPLVLCARAFATPIACGNTVVLKVSEISPGTQIMLATLLHEAGLPKGVLNVISAAPESTPKIVEEIVSHPAVRRVNFTGSSRVGRIIAELAGRHLKPTLLELGGKSPLVVLDDADIDAAVDAAIFGSFLYQGQICMSTERLVVDQVVAEAFVSKLGSRAAALKSGDPQSAETVVGPLVSRSSLTRLQGLIANALEKGAKLVAGGTVEGGILSATVLDHVTPAMRIYSEESFGPIVVVIRVADTDEAIRVANDSEYGLASSVFGRDVARALDVAARIESGACHINGPTVHDEPHIPFGGMKASGYGRFNGIQGVYEFTDTRWITVDAGAHHYPF